MSAWWLILDTFRRMSSHLADDMDAVSFAHSERVLSLLSEMNIGGPCHVVDQFRWRTMTGSVSQIGWAERIKRTVADEFDRLLRAFQRVADTQSGVHLSRTLEVIAVAERKRAEVMAREDAGYFIRDWQDISDQTDT
jgi:hypothetical protein